LKLVFAYENQARPLRLIGHIFKNAEINLHNFLAASPLSCPEPVYTSRHLM